MSLPSSDPRDIADALNDAHEHEHVSLRERLRAVPPDTARTEGGALPDLDGERWPYAKLPDAIYAMVTTSWRLAPVSQGKRKLRVGATEQEKDWKLFLAGPVRDVVGGDQAPAARSAILKYKGLHDDAPLICLTYRVPVGAKTATRRIPRSGRLTAVLELTLGRRNVAWSPEIADTLLGWVFHVQTRTQTRGRRRKGEREGPLLPEALHRTWGEHIIAAIPPQQSS